MPAVRTRRIRLGLVAVVLVAAVGTLNARPVEAITPLPFGVNTYPSGSDGSMSWDAEDTARAVSDIAPGGIVRYPVIWRNHQPGTRWFGGACQSDDSALVCTNPGTLNLAPLTANLEVLAEAGLRVLLVPMSAPAWNRDPGDVASPNPGEQVHMPPGVTGQKLAQWKAFIMALVTHVQAIGDAADNEDFLAAIEVWNEPAGKVNWTLPAGADPERYKHVLCFAYAGVNQVDPGVPVLFAGLNPQPPWGYPNKMTQAEFIGRAYAAGAGGCFDSMGTHPYPYGPSATGNPPHPSTLPGMLTAFEGHLDALRTIMANAGDTEHPISITEINIVVNFSEPLMADFLVDAYQAAELMDDVDMFIVHTLYDVGTDPSGICDEPGISQQAADDLKDEIAGTSLPPADC